MKKLTLHFPLAALAVFIILVCSGIYLEENKEDRTLLTLDRIFLEREFSSGRFERIQRLDDGSGYMTLEPFEAENKGRDIAKYDPATGQREVLVLAAHLVPEGSSQPLAIEEYSWSQNMKKLLIFPTAREFGVGSHHQRNFRLGVRRGVRRPRWIPLEP